MSTEKNRVILVNPPYTKENYYGSLKDMSFVFPPIGLIYLAGYLKQKGVEVKIFDFQVGESENIKTFTKLLEEFKPEIVGITCQTALFYNTVDISKKIKKILPNSKIVVGGVHPTFRPNDLLKLKEIDMVIRGEGELTLYELASKKNIEKILGLSFKKKGKLIHNLPRPIERNIDFEPDIDLLPMGKYKVSPDNRTGSKVAVIITSRGCPFSCVYCACGMMFNKTYRYRKLDLIEKEIDQYIKKYNIDQLFIMDDVFSLNKDRTIELCKRFIKKGYNKKISIWAQTRVDCIDEEVLSWMKKANFKILSFGIETGVQRLLDVIGKKTTVKQIRKAVKLTRKSGIDARGSFMFCLPTETLKESIQNILFALSLPLNQVKFSVATPYPGTKLWDLAVSEGQVKENENWDRFSQMASYTKFAPAYIPLGRTEKEIKILQKLANFIFYLKPSVVFGYIKRVDSWDTFMFYIKSTYKFVRASV